MFAMDICLLIFSSDCSIDGLIDAVKRVIPLLNDKPEVFLGHGNISNSNDVKNYLFMLEDVRRNIFSMINSVFSLKEIIDSKPTQNMTQFMDKVYYT